MLEHTLFTVIRLTVATFQIWQWSTRFCGRAIHQIEFHKALNARGLFRLIGVGGIVLMQFAVGGLEFFKRHTILGVIVENLLEKLIIEVNHQFCASAIDVQVLRIVVFRTEIGGQIVLKQVGVAVAEAVNTLLLITDDEVVVGAAEAVFEQWLEILVLLAAGVLKLINHKVIEPHTHTLIYEWHITFHHLVNEVGGVGYENLIVVFAVLFQVFVNLSEQSQLPKVGDDAFGHVHRFFPTDKSLQHFLKGEKFVPHLTLGECAFFECTFQFVDIFGIRRDGLHAGA